MWKFGLFLTSFLVSSGVVCANYAGGLEAIRLGNYTQAALELDEPAAAGDAKSEYLLGFLYYHGMGVTKNYEKAFALFRDAMAQGHIEAQTFLGFLYDEGKGVPVDKQRAFELYQASANAGDVTAIINLGVMYYKGEGIAQSYSKAFELLNSIEHIDSPALQLYLGNLYYNGYAVRQDIAKAVEYYTKAAKLDDVNAHYFLGHIYQQGKGSIPADPAKALQFYTYAAQKGHPQAQFNLATLLAGGATGVVDRVQAYAWLTKAANQNVPEAGPALEKLIADMTLAELARAKGQVLELEDINPETVVSPTKAVVPQESVKLSGFENVRPIGEAVTTGGGIGYAGDNSTKITGSVTTTISTQTEVPGRSRRMIRRR